VLKDGVYYLYYGTADSRLAVATYDPSKWVVKPPENTLSLDTYSLKLTTAGASEITATATLPGGAPGARAEFVSVNPEITFSDITYDASTGKTTAKVSSQTAVSGMIVALATDPGSKDAMIANVTVRGAYSATPQFKVDGEPAKTAASGGLTFGLTFNVNYACQLDANIVLALYKNDKLVSVKTVGGPFNLTTGAVTTIETDPVIVPDGDDLEDYSARGFVWNGDMIPIMPVSVLGEWKPAKPNLALKRPVVSTLADGNYPAINAVDGDYGSLYRNNDRNWTDDHTMTVDLGYDERIDEVDIYWGSPFPGDFRIEYATSAMPDDFRTASVITGNTGGTEIIKFAPVTARYVRLYAPNPEHLGQYQLALYEFEAYGIDPAKDGIKLVKPYDIIASTGKPISFDALAYGYHLADAVFSSADLPVGAALSADGEFTWTPPLSAIGEHVITVSVDNGYAADSRSFTVSVSPPNLCLEPGVTASADTYATDDGNKLRLPALAIDGDRAGVDSRWASTNGDNHWWMADLGKDCDISKIVISWETARAATFRIDTATEAAGSANFTNGPIINGAAGTQTVNITPTTARYVRFYGLTRATSYGFSFYEFEVYER
jgi:hypothetical protein